MSWRTRSREKTGSRKVKRGVGRCDDSVREHLSSMYEVLGSVPSTVKDNHSNSNKFEFSETLTVFSGYSQKPHKKPMY